MKNKKMWLLVIGILVFVLLLNEFYYKPQRTRSRCLADAEFNQEILSTNDFNERQDKINKYYLTCVRGFGLTK